MSSVLAEARTAESRGSGSDEKNAFDLLRLVLALFVVYTHAYLIGGYGTEGFARLTKLQTEAGSLAVLGFFGISGFLVTRSFATRADARAFLKARALRIFPGFYFALLVTAFVLAPVIAHFNRVHAASWSSGEAFSYLARNAFLKVQTWNIGNVLSGLPYDGSINGSLWSLFPEACCYGLVLLLGMLSSMGNRRFHGLVAVAVLALFHAALVIAPERDLLVPSFLQLSGWASYFLSFFVGASIYQFKDELGLGRKGAFLSVIGVLLLLKFGGWKLLGPLLLPFAAIHLAYSFQLRLPVDLSFGLYVMHFPLLQLASALGINHRPFAIYFLATLVATAVLATISWYCIEKPALSFKRRAPKVV